MGKVENMVKEVNRLIRMKKAVKEVLQNIEDVDTSKTILRDCPPVSQTRNDASIKKSRKRN
jgi:hypothetical protein